MATAADSGAPATAQAMACVTAAVVQVAVERPRQVARVSGLKR